MRRSLRSSLSRWVPLCERRPRPTVRRADRKRHVGRHARLQRRRWLIEGYFHLERLDVTGGDTLRPLGGERAGRFDADDVAGHWAGEAVELDPRDLAAVDAVHIG